ncbi:MAG TPA: isoprenylcysteine carboxylmethyltransferase family protein [Phycisphaerae bacterium]|nr:isoprenylcysteine carboxylmethyltransferase family protein [Phycisphaerae bacterium]
MSAGLLVRVVLFLGVTAALLFGSAGRLDLPFFWAFFGVVIAAWLIALSVIDRGLMQERRQPGPGGTDRQLRFFILPIFAALLVVAGLDAGRFQWSCVPPWVQLLALAAVAAAYGLSIWAMAVNRFYSPVVRIQTDRGHQLITSGPYAYVRHPGYAGSLLVILATGPALGSWWALLPAGAAAACLLRRLLIEDRFLHAHLDGYVEYGRRVRCRLVPGLW